ncbi:hypothetical protein [Aquisalinus flavus]|uniref:DUF4142 domain-containing protein n=1 Tax=Aquisalinus flavus TaxID=1526572 RepID=A0A8J2V420_9PROT|nr:hypothetical protein [Aquisalinus flavus]MBD0426879.1 hypothetical protein [Aquisalinus flavus]UNE46725.1 hypothetical protein FF099_00945 [Aquisalinus flavus]GGC96690.1 hypothetical protein GCM10011342_01930 [Aquisalinus flavus]
MVRIVFTLIAAAVLVTGCATVPADQANPATAGNNSQKQPSTADQRTADLRALDQLTGILLAASESYDIANTDAAAASLVRAGEAPSLYETLGGARQSLAREVQARVADLGGELRETASADGEGFYVIVDIANAVEKGPALVLAEALVGETYLIDRLRGYLSDPAISVETKTFFQEILPGLRAERDAIALLVDALPEGSLPEENEGDPQPDSEDTVSPEGETGEDSDADTLDEEPGDATAAADATMLAAQS